MANQFFQIPVAATVGATALNSVATATSGTATAYLRTAGPTTIGATNIYSTAFAAGSPGTSWQLPMFFDPTSNYAGGSTVLPTNTQIRAIQFSLNAEWGSPVPSGAGPDPTINWNITLPSGHQYIGSTTLFASVSYPGSGHAITTDANALGAASSPIIPMSALSAPNGGNFQQFQMTGSSSNNSSTNYGAGYNFTYRDWNAWESGSFNALETQGYLILRDAYGNVIAANYYLNGSPVLSSNLPVNAVNNGGTYIGQFLAFITFNSVGGNMPLVGINDIYFVVYFNEPPTFTAAPLINGTTGGTIDTLTPTITWTYTDPEGDAQAGYEIVVLPWTGATTSQPGGFGGVNLVNTAPIWSSGMISGSASSFTIPTGVLNNVTHYCIQVIVTDSGSNGRTNDPTAFISQVYFATEVNPVVPPAFTPQWVAGTEPTFILNPTGGPQLGPLNVMARLNGATPVDSIFSNTAFSAYGAGSWTFLTGVGTIAIGAAFGSTFLVGPPTWTALITCTSAPATVGPALIPVAPNTVYMASICLSGEEGTTHAITLGLQFYTAANVAIGSPVTRLNRQQSGGGGTTTKCWVASISPPNAAYVQFFIEFVSTTGAVNVQLFQLINSSLNLVDDPSMINGLQYWCNPNATTQPAVATFTETSGMTNGSPLNADESAVETKTALYCATNSMVVAPPGGGTHSSIPFPMLYAVHGTQWFFSADVAQFSGLTFFGITDATPTVVAGGTQTLTPDTWTKLSLIWNAVSFTTTDNAFISIGTGSTGIDCYVSNVQFEPVLPLVNLNLTTTGTIPRYPSLGASENTIGWYNPSGVGSLSFIAGPFIQGINNASVSQMFSVGGYTTVTFSGTTITANLSLTCYDAGGNELYAQVGSTGAYQQTVTQSFSTGGAFSATFNIPVGASYAVFSAGFLALVLPPLTFTFTGTLTHPPYTGGGWSQGAQGLTTGVVLQSSYNNGMTWNAVRSGANPTTSPVPVSLTAPQATFYDSEWEGIYLGYADTLATRPIYSSFTSITSSQVSTTSMISPQRSFYRGWIPDWWLIDPINQTYVKLNVKDVKMSRTQTQQKYSGLGRSRVVVIGDVIQGDVITLDLFSFGPTDFASLMADISSSNVFLLRSPDGEQWYVTPTKRDRSRTWTGTYARPLRTHSIELQEIDIPT